MLKMCRYSAAFFLLYSLFVVGESTKILGVFPSPGYSQFILAERLMTELAKRGHEVTVIAPYEPKTSVKNYRTILSNKTLEIPAGECLVQYTDQ